MTGLDEEILKFVRPIYDKDVTDAAQELLDKIGWLQSELARRYLIGAIEHLTDAFLRNEGNAESIVEARKLLIKFLNENTPGFRDYLDEKNG